MEYRAAAILVKGGIEVLDVLGDERAPLPEVAHHFLGPEPNNLSGTFVIKEPYNLSETFITTEPNSLSKILL